MMQQDDTAFRVGPWLVAPARNRITRGTAVVPLEPRVMAVLVCLAQQPGRVLTREQLLASAWGDAVVGDEALTRCISLLRRAFDDDPLVPSFIETIRKTGYRLIAPVERPPFPEAARPATALSAGAPPHAAPPAAARWGWALLLGLSAAGLIGVLWLSAARTAPPASVVVTPFTAYVGNEMQPAVAPDGNHVAFAWDDRQGSHMDLYVQALHAGTPMQLTADTAYEVSPAFSPDGSRIAYARVWDGCHLFVVPVLGGAPRKVGPCSGWGNPQLDWSPDGATLAVAEQASRQAPRRIALVALGTGAQRPLTTPPPDHGGDHFPAFSPDGRRVAFARITDRVGELFTVPVAGGTPRQLTFDQHRIGGLSWTADGRHLVFSSDRSGTFSLWRVPATGGTPELLLAASEPIYHPSVSPTGGVLYEQWRVEVNIYRLPTRAEADSAPEAFLTSTRLDGTPRYAPDGRRVAFISNRSGHHELWLAAPPDGPPMPLTAFEGAYVDAPAWSPDGQRLAFEARQGGPADVYVAEAEGGAARRLTTHAARDVLPAWSPDGRWVFFASDRGGGWNVWKAPAEGGEAVPVTHDGGYRAQAPPDGTTLIFSRPGEDGLWQQPLQGGPPEPVLDLAIHEDNWTVTPAGLYFVFIDALMGPHLALLDVAAGDVTVLRPLPGLPRPASLTLSPDGAYLLYAQLDQSESDLMHLHELP